MNNLTQKISWKDFLFLVGAISFLFGCIASMHRSAKTLDQGQYSFSGSYLRAENLDESDAEPIQLGSFDARMGVTKGVDLGLMHTWDFSKDNENRYATFWGDVKFQLTNKENTIYQPIFSTGLMKGYVYDEHAKYHITTLPLMFSIPVSEKNIPFFVYRYEIISKDFIPDDFENPRHTFALGMEMALGSPDSKSVIPKLGFSIGHFNSLLGGEGDSGLILNLGFMFDTISPE